MPKTVADLVAATGLHEDTVRAGIQCGQLPGYQVGTKYVIPDNAYEDLIHGRWVPQHRVVVEIVNVEQPQSPQNFLRNVKKAQARKATA